IKLINIIRGIGQRIAQHQNPTFDRRRNKKLSFGEAGEPPGERTWGGGGETQRGLGLLGGRAFSFQPTAGPLENKWGGEIAGTRSGGVGRVAFAAFTKGGEGGCERSANNSSGEQQHRQHYHYGLIGPIHFLTI